MFWIFIDLLQAWSWIKNFQQQYTYIIKGGKIWKGFISVYLSLLWSNILLFREKIIATEHKNISKWKLKYFYPAQQQTTTIDRRLKMKKKIKWKKKENQKAFVRDARRPWMKAK
mgnify:CR=1 FL=1